MAATMNARRDKPATISFTLPISCQICLGKVKQPVLCPNNHVFCSPCMDVWLQRIQQCPACRTPVNSSNPIKHIKGGLNQVEDNKEKMTNPDMRRARFELLYKEYEDEFSHLESEVNLLKKENEILKEQLSRRDERSEGSGRSDFIHPGSSDTSSLMTLTKKLQDAQKLYERLKNDMKKVNEENNKLKDERVNLNRENEKLRMEIATRSPHRYGRYTVATLEAKVESYEKEVRQLNKALERSDRYVEDLESELKNLKGIIPGKSSSVPPKSSLDSRNKDIVSENPAKRQLFGSSMDDLRNLHAGDLNSVKAKQMPTSTGYQKVTSDRAFGGSVNGFVDSKSRSQKGMQKRDDTEVTTNSTSDLGSPTKDRSPKKVHFSLPQKAYDTLSFELDQPSPLTPSSALEKLAIGNGRSSPSEIESRYFERARYARKNSGDGNSSLDSFDGLGKKGKSILKTTEKYDDISSTSQLSVPDFETTPTKRFKHKRDLELSDLDDTQTIRSELDDLNISLTPELSDCMKLLNRAEKKTHIVEGTVPDTAGTTDTARDNYISHDGHLLSTNLTTAPVHPYHSNPDSLLGLQDDEYYGKVRSNHYKMQTVPSNSGSGHSKLAFSDARVSSADVYPKVVTSLPGSSLPYTGVSNYDTLPAATSVSHSHGESAHFSRGQFKGIQNVDEKLHMLDITGDRYKASGLSDPNVLAAKSDSALKSRYDKHLPSATVPPQSFHSSLPITTSAKPPHRDLLLTTDLPPRYPIQRRSSLDYGKDVHFNSLKSADAQNLLASQMKERKYSSLTNIPAAIPLSSSALTNYSQTVGSHLHKLNKLFPVSSSSSIGSYVSTGLPHSMSSNPSFSLSLTGSTQASAVFAASSCVAHPVSRPPQALPANSLLSAAVVPNQSVVSYPATSSITFAPSALRTSSSKSLVQDRLEHLTGASDISKTGNYSYVSNTSNDLSSRGSDSYLPEPKKRLFESGDDLDLTLSPIKSTRIH